MIVVALTSTNGIKQTVHDSDSNPVPWHQHGTAGPPLVFDRVVPVHPVRVVAVALRVVPAANCIKRTLYNCATFVDGQTYT